LPDRLDRGGVDDAVLGVRVEGPAVRIGRDLRAVAVDARDAVHRRVEVDPGRQALRVEAHVARRWPEVDDVLLRDRDELADELREQAWQPRTSREHEGAGPDPLAAVRFEVEEAVAFEPAGLD